MASQIFLTCYTGPVNAKDDRYISTTDLGKTQNSDKNLPKKLFNSIIAFINIYYDIVTYINKNHSNIWTFDIYIHSISSITYLNFLMMFIFYISEKEFSTRDY